MEVPLENRRIYIERRRSDLKTCLSCLAKKDFTQLARIGHQFKGNASTFGFPELSQIGRELEQNAKFSDSEKILLSIKKFEEWLKKH